MTDTTKHTGQTTAGGRGASVHLRRGTRRDAHRHGATDSPDRCAHCGDRGSREVTGLIRAAVLVYCSAGCRDDHLAALALAATTCAAPGCDLEPAADVPFCDQHLDPAETDHGPGGGRWAA